MFQNIGGRKMPKVKYLIGTYYERIVNGKTFLLAYYGRYKDKYQFGGFNEKMEHIIHEEPV